MSDKQADDEARRQSTITHSDLADVQDQQKMLHARREKKQQKNREAIKQWASEKSVTEKDQNSSDSEGTYPYDGEVLRRNFGVPSGQVGTRDRVAGRWPGPQT